MTELVLIHGLAASREIWRHVIGLLPGASAGATRVREALATVASSDLRQALRELPLPVGAVWGERDHVIPQSALHEFRRCRPEARVEFVAGAGHIPMIERPRAFADALIALMGDAGSTA